MSRKRRLKKRRLLPAVAVLVAGCVAAATPRTGPVEEARGGLFVETQTGAPRVGDLRYRGGLRLDTADGAFGGLSALDVTPDGRQLTAVSDDGMWFRLDLTHDDQGRLTDAGLVARGQVTGANGRFLPRKSARDAESLARLPDGRLVIAFEQNHRLVVYDDAEFVVGTELPIPPGLRRARDNSGLEGLTVLADGRLFGVAENASGEGTTAWISNGDSWDARAYPLDGSFRPTGAATLPNGDVLVLERRASILGLNGRIVRVSQDQLNGGGALVPVEVARLDAGWDGPVDNFEGIAVAQNDAGETLVFVVSDDNFSILQRTLILMFSIVE